MDSVIQLIYQRIRNLPKPGVVAIYLFYLDLVMLFLSITLYITNLCLEKYGLYLKNKKVKSAQIENVLKKKNDYSEC